MFFRHSVLLALLCGLWAGPALAMRVDVSLGNLAHPAFVAENVRLRFDLLRPGVGEIAIARLQVADIEYRALRLVCERFSYDGARLACPLGQLHREETRGRERPPLPFFFEWRADGDFDFALENVDAGALSPLVERLRGWNPQGRIDLRLRVTGKHATLTLAVRELSFANRAGDVAGTGMRFSLDAQARREDGRWRWQARVDWPEGQLDFALWRRAGGVRIDAAGSLSPTQFAVDGARLAVEGIGAVTASLRWDRERGEATDWGLVSERIDLGAAMREWLQPWLAGLGFPVWHTEGEVLFAAEWQGGALRRFYAGLENATLADGTGYIELAGLAARIPWDAQGQTQAEIRAAAGRFGALPLGGFEIPLRLHGATARVENLVAPLLDGRFEIEALVLEKSQGQWRAEFAGGIEGVSMPKLAQALGLPRMEGRLNARVPRIAFEDDVLNMDGAITLEVFDGGIIVHHLRMSQPFSKHRRLSADVVGLNLDLGMLTRTYAFGSIEGRFDIYLRALELAGWRPLAFDARIESSAGDYPRILSLGALKDIAELGEPEEGRALRRLPERSIGGFGYSTIGLGCVLADGVCRLSGIAGKDTPERVQIMAGSGFPSIDIYGYNRRIDWDALVGRFRQVVVSRPAYHNE